MCKHLGKWLHRAQTMHRYIPAVLSLKEQEVVKVQTPKKTNFNPKYSHNSKDWTSYVIHKIYIFTYLTIGFSLLSWGNALCIVTFIIRWLMFIWIELEMKAVLVCVEMNIYLNVKLIVAKFSFIFDQTCGKYGKPCIYTFTVLLFSFQVSVKVLNLKRTFEHLIVPRVDIAVHHAAWALSLHLSVKGMVIYMVLASSRPSYRLHQAREELIQRPQL